MLSVEKLAKLKPGEGVHFGHSYVVVNISGIRIALDAATENGYCALPFENLTISASENKEYLTPIINPQGIIPSAVDLAQSIDYILYSHTHSDHFNAAILKKMIDANPDLKVIAPVNTKDLLAYRPKKINKFWRWLAKTGLLWNHNLKLLAEGVWNYLSSPRLESDFRLIELDNDQCYTIRKNPLIEIQAFHVRHPGAQFYIRLPFEFPKLTPVNGYEISYEEGHQKKCIILIGESGSDPEMLWRIWETQDRLIGLFVPIGDEATTRGWKWIKDTFIHASLKLIPLVERLSGTHTKIICLHQGLWYYAINHTKIESGRSMLHTNPNSRSPSRNEIYSDLENARKARGFSPTAIYRYLKLIRTISGLPSKEKISSISIGQVFQIEDAYKQEYS